MILAFNKNLFLAYNIFLNCFCNPTPKLKAFSLVRIFIVHTVDKPNYLLVVSSERIRSSGRSDICDNVIILTVCVYTKYTKCFNRLIRSEVNLLFIINYLQLKVKNCFILCLKFVNPLRTRQCVQFVVLHMLIITFKIKYLYYN